MMNALKIRIKLSITLMNLYDEYRIFEHPKGDFPLYVSVGAAMRLPNCGLRPYNWFR
jgi:hypothetical protein